MKVKICGITNLADAKAALSFGADFIGFIFAKSPRRITPEKAKQIIARLPKSTKTVGVFVNENAADVNQIAKELKLKYVQLHGDEAPAYCKKVKAKIIKVIRPRSRRDLKKIKKYKKAYAILLDTYSKARRGGTGRTFNWDLAVLAKKLHPRIILSGGLTPKNAASAAKQAKPFALDVSSGVEKRPGKKGRRRLRKFLSSARIKS